MLSYSAHACSQGGEMTKTYQPEPEQVFKIPVPVVKKPNWKNENLVPVDKNRNYAQGIRFQFRFLKTSFPITALSSSSRSSL